MENCLKDLRINILAYMLGVLTLSLILLWYGIICSLFIELTTLYCIVTIYFILRNLYLFCIIGVRVTSLALTLFANCSSESCIVMHLSIKIT